MCGCVCVCCVSIDVKSERKIASSVETGTERERRERVSCEVEEKYWQVSIFCFEKSIRKIMSTLKQREESCQGARSLAHIRPGNAAQRQHSSECQERESEREPARENKNLRTLLANEMLRHTTKRKQQNERQHKTSQGRRRKLN